MFEWFKKKAGEAEVIRVVHWEDKRVRFYIKGLYRYDYVSEYFCLDKSGVTTLGLEGYPTKKAAESDLPRIVEMIRSKRKR